MIAFATPSDLDFCVSVDSHVSSDRLKTKIENNEIIIATSDKVRVGYLRFNYFWDEIPFMNLLWVPEEYRGVSLGTDLVAFWETQMKQDGHKLMMTSKHENETAQHFYRKLGYRDIGSFDLDVEIGESEGPELLLAKEF